MSLGERSVLNLLVDLIRVNQDRYFQITTACDAVLVVAISFFVTNQFKLPLCNIEDGEGSHASLSHLDLHEHTIRPKHYERDARFLLVGTTSVLYALASIPIQRDGLQKAAHVTFMLASALLAVMLVVFAYLSKSTQSHNITNECTVAWYVLAGMTILLSANRLLFFLAMRTVLAIKKKG